MTDEKKGQMMPDHTPRSEVVHLKVAVLEGGVNDYAVYVAPHHWLNNEVRDGGLKLSAQQGEWIVRTLQDANLIKPGFLNMEYRK